MIPHINNLETYLKDTLLPQASKGDALTWPRLIESMCKKTEEEIRNQLVEYLEEMDRKFRYSEDRLNKYYVKNTRKRTLITMYGEITFRRTQYINLSTKKPYCYVDDKLGIDSRIRYTNDVAAYCFEAYADENSMIKVGKEVGNLIHAKFSLDKNDDYAIPRQTVQRMLKRVKATYIKPLQEKKRVEDIYILMDEKYLPDHNDPNKPGSKKKKKMTKVAMIVEGLDTSNKRHKYLGVSFCSLYKGDFSLRLLEHLNDRYDLEYLKHIHVLADGGTWIKTVSDEISVPNAKLTKYLCKFHFHQALNRIFPIKDIYDLAIDYIYHDKQEDLYELFNATLKSVKEELNINTKEDEESSSRYTNLKNNINYIKNNYSEIMNMISLENMNCAMEQCISHHICSEFSNVPKVYSGDNLNLYLSMRDNYRNKENIKMIYLLALNDADSDSECTYINKKIMDFSIVENITNEHCYTYALEGNKTPVCF